MATNLDNYTAYLFDSASQLYTDAKNSLIKLQGTCTHTRLKPIEEQVNKLVLLKKPLSPKTTDKFNDLCKNTFQPYFNESKIIFQLLLKSNFTEKESNDLWSKDFKLASTLARSILSIVKRIPLQH